MLWQASESQLQLVLELSAGASGKGLLSAVSPALSLRCLHLDYLGFTWSQGRPLPGQANPLQRVCFTPAVDAGLLRSSYKSHCSIPGRVGPVPLLPPPLLTVVGKARLATASQGTGQPHRMPVHRARGRSRHKDPWKKMELQTRTLRRYLTHLPSACQPVEASSLEIE